MRPFHSTPSAFNEAELYRLDAIIHAQLSSCRQTWQFFNEDSIDEDQWMGQLASLRWMSQQPGFARWWPIWKSSNSASVHRIC